METTIERIIMEPIISTMVKGIEIMVAKFTCPEPWKYEIPTDKWPYTTKYKTLKEGQILVCIGKVKSKEILVMKKFRGMTSALTYYKEFADMIRDERLNVTLNLE